MAKVSHMHRGNVFRRRRFFKERIDRFSMQHGLEETLKLREHLIHVISQLDF